MGFLYLLSLIGFNSVMWGR